MMKTLTTVAMGYFVCIKPLFPRALAFTTIATRSRLPTTVVRRILATTTRPALIVQGARFASAVLDSDADSIPYYHGEEVDLLTYRPKINGFQQSQNYLERIEKLEVPQSKLRWVCDPAIFPFNTTDELQDLRGTLLGQARAQSAIEFGVNVHRDGYNLFVLGQSGAGKRTIVRNYLEKRSMKDPPAYDWAYIHNFDNPDRPKALQLPAGRGAALHKDTDQLIEDVQTSILQAMESKEHQAKVQQVQKEAMMEHENALQEFTELLRERQSHVKLLQTPNGVILGVPTTKNGNNGNGNSEEEDSDHAEDKEIPLSPTEQEQARKDVEEMAPKLREILSQIPVLQKDTAMKVKELNREVAENAIQCLFEPLKEKYEDLPAVVEYLQNVENNIVERSEDIHRQLQMEQDDPMGMDAVMKSLRRDRQVSFGLYKINLIVNNNETAAEGAPVVYEDHPFYNNLIGRVDHLSQLGAFVTDFSLIKAGSLHRANGGYLVVHAHDLLTQPGSWEALKRSLRTGEIKIQSLGEEYSMLSTVTIQPEPIKLNVKVVLLGDRFLYYLLKEHDPDFGELFKVAADFNDEMARDSSSTEDETDTCQLYARMIHTIATDCNLKPLNREAVALCLEQAARRVGDQEKLSTHVQSCSDLLCESDYWASQDNATVISADHVRKAIDQQVYRNDRIRQLIYEEIRRGTILVDVQGKHVGQVNGLSVLSLGGPEDMFGRPSRITATARLGNAGKVLDIEREVELGGPTHSKGVMILSSLLASRYAHDCPLCLSASLVFEQSYGMVDGDSASMAELCALLSALANVPIGQDLAITGSVNQLGQAQGIGGATQKIEGFYDVCKAKANGGDLPGTQGVLIPGSNVQHLMLREDIVQAVREGKFHVYSYNTVNEALELLTGLPAGERLEEPDDQGRVYPPGTINDLVDRRLHSLAQLQHDFAQDPKQSNDAEEAGALKSTVKPLLLP